ncbi:MAG: HPr kinase/phosphorylase [Boseongicola sp.]
MDPVLHHASAVAIGQSGLLIKGPSGSGKSSLALDLIALGATLVADDCVLLTQSKEGGILMAAPKSVEGLIEARGIGLLKVRSQTARLVAVVDLSSVESDRLPDSHETVIKGDVFPILRKVESASFPAMLVAYLKGGRAAP